MNKKFAVTFAAVLAVAALPVAVAAADAPPSATIASATALDFRAVVTATKTSPGDAPSASAYIAAFKKTNRKWSPLGNVRVGRANGFFWKVLTGRRAIRRFSIGTSSPERITVQVLLSPALGWSPVYAFHVENGRLVRG